MPNIQLEPGRIFPIVGCVGARRGDCDLCPGTERMTGNQVIAAVLAGQDGFCQRLDVEVRTIHAAVATMGEVLVVTATP